MIKIDELKKEQLMLFIRYLDTHLSENGKGVNPLFLPFSQEQLKSIKNWEEKFERGLHIHFGKAGWRKLWIATNEENIIIGHIDIRAYNELNTAHRVLLGMEVDSNFRRLKIGQKMLELVIDYCKKHSKISWIDLQVMTLNTPAIRLYKKLGFQELANILDMFRIDNISYDYTSMPLNLDSN